MEIESHDVRLPDNTGGILSGGDSEDAGRDFAQPAVQPEGSSAARKRTADASVNYGGHRVSDSGTKPANRVPGKRT
jgi:hypothetical protein